MSGSRDNEANSDEAIFALRRASRCYNCDKKQNPGDLVRLQPGKDEQEVLCKECAGLDEFVLIPAGNAKLTRAARKYAKKHYKVLKWSELWKCYERQGLLIDAHAAQTVEGELGVKLTKTSTMPPA